jgi:hypothetical protein
VAENDDPACLPCWREVVAREDAVGARFYSQLSSTPIARKHKTAIADAISGNISTIIMASLLCEVFRHDKT